MSARRILFICQHNSARSQMAEAFLNKLGNGAFEAHSAGLEPGVINQNVVTVMHEIGYDLSENTTQSVFDLFKNGELFEIVVTVCEPQVEAQCPLFPGVSERLAWPFPDPSLAAGTAEEMLAQVRTIRDDIKARIEAFVAEH